MHGTHGGHHLIGSVLGRRSCLNVEYVEDTAWRSIMEEQTACLRSEKSQVNTGL
jgi:hypothetical protein